jgi:hypothetical protein
MSIRFVTRDKSMTWMMLQRKMLALVVANDLSVLEHIFCENQLCNDMIVDILDTNFVTWAWDVTSEVNKRRYRVNVLRLSSLTGVLVQTV